MENELNLSEEVEKGAGAQESAADELRGDIPERDAQEEPDSSDDVIDYEQLMADDLLELKGEFPELDGVTHVSELGNPMRYAQLRDLGLTPTEAYLAARGKQERHDNRAHLRSSAPRGAHAPVGSMPRAELERARELFSGLDDSEIQRLYRKVCT